jgi:hypothetical protein
VWGAAVFTFETLAIYSGEALAALFCIPFVLVALFLMVGRFLFDATSRRRTFYALTNERALIVSGMWSRQTTSIELRALRETHLSLRASGLGTITFGRGPTWLRGVSWPKSPRYVPPAFDGIPDAAAVEALIRKAQRAVD